jgi:lipopolysaccharide/colanic/teichoic acid biosynthesis glycosyltransferase
MCTPRQVIITGATGFIGSLLIPRLQEAGCELLLVGRSSSRIETAYPSIAACTYQDLADRGAGFDLLIHLAVINSDSSLSDDEIRSVNVDLAIQIANAASETGIPKMLNISSTHALDSSNDSAYARSKREAAELLEAVEDIEVCNLYLPLVYGERFSGKLARLNVLPKPLASPLFVALAALKPTCHIDLLVAHILAGVPGEPRILSDRQMTNPVYRAATRAVDLAFALVVVVFFSWLLLLTWVAIRLDSPGPGILRQMRVGRGAQEFVCYKFRTMKAGTRQAGTHEVSAAEVTSVGAFLRKTKLDELPQILNIFRNEIALIGPRPCLPVQTELVEERKRRGVLDLKPGISGLAQVNKIDMSDPHHLAIWDARYAALRTLPMDLSIAVATFRGKGRGDNTTGSS